MDGACNLNRLAKWCLGGVAARVHSRVSAFFREGELGSGVHAGALLERRSTVRRDTRAWACWLSRYLH